jgi:hypothetical protein
MYTSRFLRRNHAHGISRCCWEHARYKPGNLHYPACRAVRDMAPDAEERPDLLSAAANEVTEDTCIRSWGSRGHGPLRRGPSARLPLEACHDRRARPGPKDFTPARRFRTWKPSRRTRFMAEGLGFAAVEEARYERQRSSRWQVQSLAGS